MWRYVSVSIIIGLIVSTCVFVLYEAGVFLRPAADLWEFYEASDLIAGVSTAMGPVDLFQFAVFTGLALGIAWCVIDIPRTFLNASVTVGALLLTLGLSFTLALYGVYFEPFSGCTAILLSFVLATAYTRSRPGRRKRLLLAVMGSRISSGSLLKLLGTKGDLPESKTRALTVLTCRIFNQPQLMRDMNPQDHIALTNLLLRNVIELLLARGAFVDESRPECIRAFFGVIPSDDHAAAACRAALELNQRLVNLNAESERRFFQTLQYGIGVSSGPVNTGIFGSEREAFFSGMGSEIVFSRKLCALNLSYGSHILIGAGCYGEVSEQFEVRPMEMVYVEEDDVMTEVYELLAENGQLSEERQKSRDAFWQGIIYFREGNFDSAIEQFTLARLDGKEDAPLDFYIAKAQGEVVHPGGKTSGETGGGDSGGPTRSGGMIRL